MKELIKRKGGGRPFTSLDEEIGGPLGRKESSVQKYRWWAMKGPLTKIDLFIGNERTIHKELWLAQESSVQID